jgi:hypothetical protein
MGSDFATSARARLEVEPGLPGANRFVLRVTDYDSGEPVTAQRVALRFSYLGGAEVEQSILELRPAEGVYRAMGSNLSIGGPWDVTALVQRGADAVEVPFQVATICTATEIPGEPPLPTSHVVEVPDAGSVEGYLIDLGGGEHEVHFTFLDAEGKELRVKGQPSIVAWHPETDAVVLEPEPLSRGHFLAMAHLEHGHWRFDGVASGGGASLAGCFEQMIED